MTEVGSEGRPTDPRFLDRWRISEMELWAADFIDLDVPRQLHVRGYEQGGGFQFGMVVGWLDQLRGRIFIHMGDDSGFVAIKQAVDPAPNPRARRRPRP